MEIISNMTVNQFYDLFIVIDKNDIDLNQLPKDKRMLYLLH